MALPKLFQRIFFHNNTTPALNEDNLNAMSKGLSDVDDRLIELAGTIMEDVPAIQYDLEILEPAIENIDANVARAETAADNAEEEALKSEGYAVGTQDGVEVTSGEYYQNNAKYYAEIANPPIENTVDFTDIITISDAINKAAKDVRLKVEAVQDLHGYNNPWVGGAGKNLLQCNFSNGSSSGMSWTADKDNADNVVSMTLNGTYSGSSRYFLKIMDCYLEAGNYYLSGAYNAYAEIFIGGDLSITNNNPTVPTAFTVSTSDTYPVYVAITQNRQLDNAKLYPMIRKATEADATFEPYTNICPISGWDDAIVTRSGKNLFDNIKAVSGYYLKEDGTTNASGSWNISNYIKVNGSVVMSTSALSSGNAPSICWYDKNKNFLGGEKYSNRNTVAVSLPFNAAYVRISFYNDWVNITQLELGTTPTTFEPYQGNFYLIELDGTRYGGTLDVTRGVLTLNDVYEEHTLENIYVRSGNANCDFAVFTLSQAIPENLYARTNVIFDKGRFFVNGTETFDNISQYGVFIVYSRVNKQLAISVPKGATLADAQAMFGTIGIVYPLATPQTIQLAPIQVYLLYGYNTLFGDCGDISLTYDASGIIHIEEAKLDTETLKTIAAASSDFADFKARIAGL